MRRFYSFAAGLSVLAFLLCASFNVAAQIGPNDQVTAPPEISFTVSMSKPYTHLLEVEMRIRGAAKLPLQINLIMPVWTPGSYLIREFERNVQDFAAVDASGHALSWQKTNKDTWRVETAGARELRVTYRVYANEMTVRTNDLNDRHAFWNNAALLMYPEGYLNAPSTLTVVPFGDWRVATGLPPVEGKPNTFRAENFDILYDSPVDVSRFKVVAFEVRNVPHRIVIDGEGNYDLERMRRDVPKVVEAEVAMMGEIPYHDYTFILHSTNTGGGGLEHLNSTSLMFERNRFHSDSDWKGFLGLVAHEFFHLWNVKRIRPDALGPFDYTKENYTRLLWVAEGITDYYATLMLRRAGLISEEDYLQRVARNIQSLQTTPGRLLMSAEEASFSAWIKEYRPDENSINSQISYYTKGGLLGLLLDLEIRKRSKGAKSLDDVMRYLYTEYYKKNRNYTPEDFERACELMAGSSLENFFARYVRGREELDYNAALNTVGLQLLEERPPAETVYLGANVAQDGDRLMIRTVLSGSPAYDQGLNAGDQIVALDGQRVNRDSFLARLSERRPGDVINLTLFRDDDLRTFTVKLGKSVAVDYKIVRVKEPTPEQTRQYRAWLGVA
ncbi:MAG TPA: PDZ domain-containing protein, partial [Pyrinomonadaceae bacterium]|nr:PDZ domain-containing protein [Pyrinomonadaceae bacterium]